jgi:hypothetical protein
MACTRACVDRALREAWKTKTAAGKARAAVTRALKPFERQAKRYTAALDKLEGFAAPDLSVVSFNDALDGGVELNIDELRELRPLATTGRGRSSGTRRPAKRKAKAKKRKARR